MYAKQAFVLGLLLGGLLVLVAPPIWRKLISFYERHLVKEEKKKRIQEAIKKIEDEINK